MLSQMAHKMLSFLFCCVIPYSMEATTRKAQANISIEEQIAALHKAKGLL